VHIVLLDLLPANGGRYTPSHWQKICVVHCVVVRDATVHCVVVRGATVGCVVHCVVVRGATVGCVVVRGGTVGFAWINEDLSMEH